MSRPRAGRAHLLALVLVTLASTLAIVATYPRLSHTWDEGTHVVAGVQLLQHGRYTYQTENPPLPRALMAVIPYLDGVRFRGPVHSGWESPADAFYRTPDYVWNVTEARVANILPFWLCVALTWMIAGGRRDPWVAFLAAAAVATLPPIVAHAGFATTDVSFVAAALGVLLALRRALARPGVASGALLGVALGIAMATKFSTLVFVPPVVLAVVGAHYWDRRGEWLRARAAARLWSVLATAAVAGALVLWGCYGFRIGRLIDLPPLPYAEELQRLPVPTRVLRWSIPAPEVIHGLAYLRAHAIQGHFAFFLGQSSSHGFLLFYPVVLVVKASGPFLTLAALGLWGLWRHGAGPRRPWFVGLALGALGVVLAALPTPLNLGVRHVLVVYPLLALPAAYGLVRWAEALEHRGAWLTAGSVGLVLMQLALLGASVPNQIAYFNVLAGREPGKVSADSDLDWGQDVLALERYAAAQPMPELYIQMNGTARLCRHRLPPLRSLPPHPVTGWIAVSEVSYRVNGGPVRRGPCDPFIREGRTIAPPGWLDWLRAHQPVAIVGSSVRVYHIELSDARGGPVESAPGQGRR
jgi:4-amino-4-deoxy-L-arabinose transferase-like glycosyltransferase